MSFPCLGKGCQIRHFSLFHCKGTNKRELCKGKGETFNLALLYFNTPHSKAKEEEGDEDEAPIGPAAVRESEDAGHKR